MSDLLPPKISGSTNPQTIGGKVTIGASDFRSSVQIFFITIFGQVFLPSYKNKEVVFYTLK
jgi:hypothetical protein